MPSAQNHSVVAGRCGHGRCFMTMPRQEETVMTFREIGAALGISHVAAQKAYERGIRKLVRNSGAELKLLSELAEESRRYSDEREFIAPASDESESEGE